MTINYNYQINSTNYNPATTTFYWRVVSRGADGTGDAGVVVDDFDVSSGTKTSDGNTTTITLGVKEQTGTQGTRNFTLEVSTSATFASNVVTKDFQVTDGAAVANNPTITPDSTTPTEGDTVTFTPAEAAGSNAATYYFEVIHGTTTNADFTADPPGNGATARTSLSWNGTSFSPSTVAVTLATGDGVDPNETFTGALYDASTGGTQVAVTNTITVTDGTPANAPGLAVDDTTPTEGSVVTFTPSEVANSAAATYYFQVSYGTATDDNFTAQPPGQGATARTALSWNGTAFTPATVTVTLSDQYTIDQGETFTGELYDASTGGSVVASATQCVIQEGAATYAMSGSTSINEPAAGITYSNTSMNLLNDPETETQNVTSVDTVDLDIQGASSSNVSASSNTTGVTVTPSSVADFSVQTPDFTVSFGNAADGVSYDVDFTDSNSTGSLQGTVTVVGDYTYTVDITNLAQNTVLYWRVEDTGTVAISADDFFSGYTTGGAATGTNGGYLSGQVTCGTDTGTAYRGTFDVRLKDKQYGSNPDFKISLYSDSGYTNKVLDGLAGSAVGEITITSQSAPTVTVSGSTSLSEPNAGSNLTTDLGVMDGADHLSLNVNSLDTYEITIEERSGSISFISSNNCTPGSWNNVTKKYTVGSFKNAGSWDVEPTDSVGSETHGGTVTVVGENTYTVTTTGVVDGTYFYWELSNDTGTTFDATADTIDAYNDNGIQTSHVGTALRGRVLINSNSGSFKVRLNHNAAQTGSPTCKLRLYQDSGYSTEVTNPTYPGTITIGAASPTYTIQGSDPLSINETASASTITVNTTNVPDSTVLYWNITTDAPGSTEATTDWQAYNSGGTGFTITGNTGSFTIDATADAFDDPGATETFYLHVRTGSDAGTSVDSIELTVNDDSLPASPTYTIQGSDPLTVSEVAVAQTITVNTTNVTNGTVLYWNITTDAPGSTEATTDWQAYNSGGTGFTINSNTGSFQIDATADAFTDGSTETFYLHVRTGSDAGTSVDSIQLSVTDDSQTASPTYTIQGSDPLTVSEVAAAQTITVNTTNVTNGTVLYWNITTDAPGTTQASTDWAAYNSGGTGFTINSNTGSFQIDATADAFTDGSTETFYLHVRTGSDTGTSVDSIQLSVTDDSQTPAGANTNHLIAFPYSWISAEANTGATNIDLEFATNGSINTSSNTFVDPYPWTGVSAESDTTTIDTQGWATDISGTFSSGADYQVQAVVTINAGSGSMALDTNPVDAMDGSTTWYGLNGGPTLYLDYSNGSASLRTATVVLTIKTWDGTGGGLGTGTTVLEKEFGFSLGVNQI